MSKVAQSRAVYILQSHLKSANNNKIAITANRGQSLVVLMARPSACNTASLVITPAMMIARTMIANNAIIKSVLLTLKADSFNTAVHGCGVALRIHLRMQCTPARETVALRGLLDTVCVLTLPRGHERNQVLP
jgi:hypothetical protein